MSRKQKSRSTKRKVRMIISQPMAVPAIKKHHRWLWLFVLVIILASIGVGIWWKYYKKTPAKTAAETTTQEPTASHPPEPTTGKILLTEAVQTYSPESVRTTIAQTNPKFDLPVPSGVNKQVFRYTTSDGKNDNVPVYGRVYLPANSATSLPVLAFAPGTTGVGDACAASLENPAKRNWANYDSLMLAYASQGYAVVLTDYEGMRDPSRIHHYMIGDQEGRAVLDSVRALKNLDSSKSRISSKNIFASGYSQGGHAAYWADQINSSYAPEIKLKGAIGFGPVTDVEETLADITKGANINWFGPYVLISYSDWYRRSYPVAQILQNRWVTNLRADVLRECIDTAGHYWPNNLGINRANLVYTPEFLKALNTKLKNAAPYQQLGGDMAKNLVGTVKTDTPKLINQGQHDNVILPRQSEAALKRMCGSGNKVLYRPYDTSPYAVTAYNPHGLVDHYTTINASLPDTLAWMRALESGQSVQNSC